ncbi:TRAP transporter 4TM/12TM fusion protein [Geomicrobium halophilum]|uniref:TRAP transporter 4TM/12TM fusion protein n=1 Tax=Geomicrobium halophilum TaxID=549000 RepID=A0A841PWC7_9BACL|nr:TRAP transporter permease [Geomicrobium halophilum]MBB6450741.1 TRAP transporter 4TM/12TM fusion protein [Geomicrobium halophilum]
MQGANHLELNNNQKKLLEKLDNESRFRSFDNRLLVLLVTIIAVSFSLYHLITAYTGTPVPVLVHRAIHVAVVLVLVFLLFPPTKKARRDRLPWYDMVLAVLSVPSMIYLFVNYEEIVTRGGLPNTNDIIFGTLLILLVFEAGRRVTGWALPLLAFLFLLYALFGRDLPGIFQHRGFEWTQMTNQLFMTTEGIFGTAIGVSATYIILFILFGAFLQKSGMGQLFNDLALAITGKGKGGPAKVSVVASGFLGSINGSAIANVVTTGAFTIPLMKKIGYNKNFAGAVESSASVGGQILPPIMGAAAFIMAETLGVPYTDIVLIAILPALLFYIGILTQVHLRASKDNLSGLPRHELPKLKNVLKERGHLLLPIFFLIYMLFFSGTTIIYSAFWTIIVTIIISFLRKSTRMGIKDIIDALESGARNTVSVAVACATVGIIVGVASLTGFGLNLANAIVAIGGESLFLTLLFTMVACIVLGMGMPSIPAYIITATMAAPALVQLGIEPIVAHLFVFYFGIFANITPPVALAAFAAAGVSGGTPMKTGFIALKLAAAGFIVPFMFVYNNDLLLMGTTFLESILVIITAVTGILMIGIAAEGFLFERLNIILGILMAGGALLFLHPELYTDALAIAILVTVSLIQWGKRKRNMRVRNNKQITAT